MTLENKQIMYLPVFVGNVVQRRQRYSLITTLVRVIYCYEKKLFWVNRR